MFINSHGNTSIISRKIQRKTAPHALYPGSPDSSCSPFTWSAAWSSSSLSSTFSVRSSAVKVTAAQDHITAPLPETAHSLARMASWRARKSSGAGPDRTLRKWLRRTFLRDSSKRDLTWTKKWKLLSYGKNTNTSPFKNGREKPKKKKFVIFFAFLINVFFPKATLFNLSLLLVNMAHCDYFFHCLSP